MTPKKGLSRVIVCALFLFQVFTLCVPQVNSIWWSSVICFVVLTTYIAGAPMILRLDSRHARHLLKDSPLVSDIADEASRWSLAAGYGLFRRMTGVGDAGEGMRVARPEVMHQVPEGTCFFLRRVTVWKSQPPNSCFHDLFTTLFGVGWCFLGFSFPCCFYSACCSLMTAKALTALNAHGDCSPEGRRDAQWMLLE